MAKKLSKKAKPLVGIVMGSLSDWATMKPCAERLEALAIPYEKRILSAHRTPVEAHEYTTTAADRGIRVLIAAAGGAETHIGFRVFFVQVQFVAEGGQNFVLDVASELRIDGMGQIYVSTVSQPAAGHGNQVVAVATFDHLDVAHRKAIVEDDGN